MASTGNSAYDVIRVFKEGSQWCALLGDNLQEGKAGFGNTKATALMELSVGMTTTVTTDTKSANSIQYGGDHYKTRSIEPWDYILANQIGFCEGNAIKYLTRWKSKGGVEDLRKAQHYIQKLIESQETK
jgi:hypothetical protein